MLVLCICDTFVSLFILPWNGISFQSFPFFFFLFKKKGKKLILFKSAP